MIETIKNTLNENQNITPEIKESLLEIIEIVNKKLSDIDLSNLNDRLKNLVIRRESKYLLKLPCQYNPHNNEIVINYGEFEKCDSVHWFTHSLISMITAKDNHHGFDNEEGQLIALNEGYTELITNYLVGAEEDNFYTAETIITNLIAKIIGEKNIYDAYFTNNSNAILDALITHSNGTLDEKKRETLLTDFNNDLVSRSNHLPTNEFEKQGMIIDYYPSITTTHPEDFYFSPEYYPEWSREYLDVENLENVVNKFMSVLNQKEQKEVLPEKKESVIEEELKPVRIIK